MPVCQWHFLKSFDIVWKGRFGPLVPSSLIIPPLHVKTHTCAHAHSDMEAQTGGDRQLSRDPGESRAEWSGSLAGTLTFTLKCFNRTKVDKGRQWRIRSYNGLSTLQVRWACYWTELFPSPQSLISPRKLVINKRCRLITTNMTSWLTRFFFWCYKLVGTKTGLVLCALASNKYTTRQISYNQ